MRLQNAAGKAKVEAVFGINEEFKALAVDFNGEFWRKYRELRPELDAGIWDYQKYLMELRTTLSNADFPVGEVDVEEFLQADWESWSHADLEMVSWIDELQDLVAANSELELALLSNIPTELLLRLRKLHPWIRKFPHSYFSCELLLAKPDTAIYQAVVADLGVDYSEVLFFDDTYENIVSARELGMQTHHFTGISGARDAVNNFLVHPQ
ncbi:MAG: HAD-IA family hydrolase [Arcanobacterium sp.]|nr:HAD-IA family hydrolase [Arcanobacterium sp.]